MQPTASEPDPETAGSFSILLVEDSLSDQRLLREELGCTDLPAKLHSVPDGAAALSFLNRRDPYSHAPIPDLVILDLDLPGIDGWEVLAEVKKDPRLRRIPVIVLTGSSSDADVIRSYDLHANGYVTKPMDPEGYCDLVKAIADFWLKVATLAPKA
ncbi:MAG: response regulator [Acidimicrobiia bacterium]|nr:MAG: response regulator [Acidimicrobiia bacterium]